MTAIRAEELPAMLPWPAPVAAVGDYYPCPDGKKRVRVTTVCKHIADGGGGLNKWHEDNGKEAALGVVAKHWDWCQGMSFDAVRAKLAPEIAAAEPSADKMTRAGDIGTEVHQKIYWRIRQELKLASGPEPKLSDPATLAYMVWEDQWNKAGLKPVLAEQWAWDDRDDTAGQWDLLVECPDRGLGLLDWKTSNYLLPQHHVQVAKYKRLIEKWRPNWHIGWVELWKVPKTLERIEIEVRSLGDCYNFKKRKQVTYSEEQLEMLWLSALAQYRVFKG